MKTTLDLPDDLMRSIKIRAVHENRRIKDMVAELLRRGLNSAEEPQTLERHRVKLPLLYGKPAASGEEITPERVAEILNNDEAEWQTSIAREPLR